MSWLGLDIGGANLKLADTASLGVVRPFALWREPERLCWQLEQLLAEAPRAADLAVTITGELADCFETKTEGVRFILRAVREAAPEREVRVYLTDGRLVACDVAMAHPLKAAAANWHALATFAGRLVPQGAAVLIDIGSTTCDLIPLVDGVPTPQGDNDTERLIAGELVYTGVQRSPMCGVMTAVPYRGQNCRVAQELFATMHDAYLVLNDLPEDIENCEMADGRAATRQAACRRLARMICADASQFDMDDAVVLAEATAAAQSEMLTVAWHQVVERLAVFPNAVVVVGHGDFLASRLLTAVDFPGLVIWFGDRLGKAMSRVATAHAVAVLAEEKIAVDKN